jgi:hypothetical protein
LRQPKLQARDLLKVPRIPGDEHQVVLQGGSSDEGIGDTRSPIAANPAGSLGDGPVYQ